MHIVDIAYLAPAQCMFTHTAEGPFIDLGREFGLDHAGRMYIKTSYARELGHFAGLPSIDELEQARAEIEDLKAQVAELEAANDAMSEFNQAAKYTVEAMGRKVQKKPGRPKKQPDQEISTAASAA